MEAAAITQLVDRRWSPRSFEASVPDTAALISLYQAAGRAPSSNNSQPWRFLVATTDQPVEHDRLAALVNERNARWATAAPVLALACAVHSLDGRRLRHAQYDTGQAVATLVVQATALGLSVRQMAGYDAEAARREYDLPPEVEPMALLAIGYRGEPEALPDDLREREAQRSDRKPLGDIVFAGALGRSAFA